MIYKDTLLIIVYVCISMVTSIGRPVTFRNGPFAHQTIRTQLEELQQANIGRKCGKKGAIFFWLYMFP
jgi:hypothetical protein